MDTAPVSKLPKPWEEFACSMRRPDAPQPAAHTMTGDNKISAEFYRGNLCVENELIGFKVPIEVVKELLRRYEKDWRKNDE